MLPKQAWYKSLGFKLAASFFLGVCFVFVLLLAAERTLTQVLLDTESLLEDELRPLAQVSRLQGQLFSIREQEVELRRTQDHFALLAQLDHYQASLASFDQNLQDLIDYLGQDAQLRQRLILASWASYQKAVEELAQAAQAGDNSRMLEISLYQGSVPFQTLVRHLQLFSEDRRESAEAVYLQLLDQKGQRFNTFILASVAALLALGSILAVFIVRLVRRVLALRDGARDLANQPKSQPLLTTGDDELAQLTRAFNEMQDKVLKREAALHESKERLELRVSERTQALRDSNAELEQFAYVASHDLRQPLRMINSYLQLLERRLGDGLDADNRKMMGFARDGAERLDQMLVSLLEYSRVGRKGQPMESLNLATSVKEALTFLGPQIKETKASVQLPEEAEWPTLHASPDEMTRLFQNLISNSLKYTQSDQAPQIDLQVVKQGSQWLVSIQDQGIGIDPSQQDRLFKVFQRLQHRNDYEGTGVGLAICRKIVERHGGAIWVESEGENLGSRFCFTLPVAT